MKTAVTFLLFSFVILLFEPNQILAQIVFERHDIDFYRNARSVFCIDLDIDGDIDILGAACQDEFKWWENEGNQNFTEHVIDEEFEDALSVFGIDLDNDNDVDIICSSTSDEISWWENDGDLYFTQNTVATEVDVRSVYAVDLDGDDDNDILCASGQNDAIVWWENDGGDEFTDHVINNDDFGTAISVHGVDLDDDDDIDVLGAASSAGVIWWENDGNQDFEEHVLFDDRGEDVYADDIDSDDDIDILTAGEAKISWGENEGNGIFTENVVENHILSAAVYSADMDGDSDIDVLDASDANDDIDWWENDGEQNFTKYTIASDFNTANDVCAADIDGDGDQDVVGVCSHPHNDITWWENLGQHYPARFNLISPTAEDTVWTPDTTLVWNATIDADEDDIPSYDVWFGTTEDLSNAELVGTTDSTEVDSLSFDLFNLDDDSEYWWKVRAQEINLRGVWSSETWSIRTDMPNSPQPFDQVRLSKMSIA